MNAIPPGEDMAPAEPAASTGPARFGARLAAIAFGRAATLALAGIALALGIATFTVLAGGSPFGPGPGAIVGLILANLAVLLLLGVSLAVRLVRVWAERRRGSAGSRLHVRLVLLFAVVATLPATLVAVFAALFFNLGIQAWFSDRVRTALEESLNASRAYLEEHRGNIRVEALAMANDMNRAAAQLLPDNGLNYARVLATQTALRGLTETQVFDPLTAQVIAHAGISTGFVLDPVPVWAIDLARTGDVAVLSGEGDRSRVRAVIALDQPAGMMMLIGRPVDRRVLAFAERAEAAVQQYHQLDENRSGLQITFALIFVIVGLLVLTAAVLIGLVLANQIARPVGELIRAAERVRGGDMTTRVPETESGDDIAALERAFNRMANQIQSKQAEVMDAYGQLDERRRFTETVLSGVSAGVIGLDAQERIELPNRAASDLLGHDLLGSIGERLADVMPEFAALLDQVKANPDRPRTAEISVGPPQRRQILLVRIGAEMQSGRVEGYVVTFDDITQLQSAQRKAAWADVARRIAHEIKNPLTPIQLSAERLKRRFLKEITSDPDTFRECADTIVRQVGDIGRMVDEFSSFARMPQPVMKPEDLGRIVREALVLQRNAHPEIEWDIAIDDPAPMLPCDRRQISQAVVNLLQNAADAVAMREGAGRIRVSVAGAGEEARIAVEDDGVGLPAEDRARLSEPYVTHKAKGTGLGLAIVKKIMEDHGGRLVLEDRESDPGARVSLLLPLKETAREHA